ncbi:MAG: desulfoferrodoxin [Chloroflexi bacterium]|nr:desulfoferrodoxin [Chloroflexota bacterium]
MAVQVGNRYVCSICGAEFIVTKAGSGSLSCDDEPLVEKSGQPVGQARPS